MIDYNELVNKISLHEIDIDEEQLFDLLKKGFVLKQKDEYEREKDLVEKRQPTL